MATIVGPLKCKALATVHDVAAQIKEEEPSARAGSVPLLVNSRCG
jgi:hypothetical protein